MDLAWQIFFGAYDETSELFKQVPTFCHRPLETQRQGRSWDEKRGDYAHPDREWPRRPCIACEGSQRKTTRQWGKRFFSIFTRTVYSGSTIWMIGAFAFCETN